jgi:hypothetical protein
MRHYNVWQLAHVIDFLRETELLAEHYCSREQGDAPVPEERMNHYYVPSLKYAHTQLEAIELTSALARFDHFNREIRQGITWAEMRNQIRVLHEAIHSELCYRRFAFVPTEKAKLHDKVGSDWADVWAKFPPSKEDTERALDCYALEQDTACVFHLMRVAEFGLRGLAKKLRVTITHKGKVCPIEYGDWEKVITEIKNNIAHARTTPAGPKKQAKLEFYSDAADHCTFMKDIWRNNVSHTRKAYNDSEANAVLDRVLGFMRFLAANV